MIRTVLAVLCLLWTFVARAATSVSDRSPVFVLFPEETALLAASGCLFLALFVRKWRWLPAVLAPLLTFGALALFEEFHGSFFGTSEPVLSLALFLSFIFSLSATLYALIGRRRHQFMLCVGIHIALTAGIVAYL